MLLRNYGHEAVHLMVHLAVSGTSDSTLRDALVSRDFSMFPHRYTGNWRLLIRGF